MGNACCTNDASAANETKDKQLTSDAVKIMQAEEVVDATVKGADTKAVAKPAAMFTIKLVKVPGLRLGVDVDLTDGICLVVDKVNPGLVEEWNKKNPDKVVQAGDKILSVNGTQGNAQQMTEVCKAEDTLEMLVQRE
mmetsp:Transcript_57635/g.165277  ORF Transcript_57635/g.165277 Transcript_57635/m.165277 type:complete len:137 (-) Transcript_57635:56-466(-)